MTWKSSRTNFFN